MSPACFEEHVFGRKVLDLMLHNVFDGRRSFRRWQVLPLQEDDIRPVFQRYNWAARKPGILLLRHDLRTFVSMAEDDAGLTVVEVEVFPVGWLILLSAVFNVCMY